MSADTAVFSPETFPITFSVPKEIAQQGVYVALFGLSGLAKTAPQVFLSSALNDNGNAVVAAATLAKQVTQKHPERINLNLPSDTIIIAVNTQTQIANFPLENGSLLITEKDANGNITAQTKVHYESFVSQDMYLSGLAMFTGVTGGTGTFSPGASVTLDHDWVLSSSKPALTNIPLLEVFTAGNTYPDIAQTVINIPAPGQTLTGNVPTTDISSGELVMFVGPNNGLQSNAAQELVVPTLSSNPNDTFGLFEWGINGTLSVNSGGGIDFDVSAIDQIGFPFNVTAKISNAPNAATNPHQPFNQGVGFLQNRTTLFNGFVPFLESLPKSSNAKVFETLAADKSPTVARITAPQDWLNFLVNSGPQIATSGISGFQPIQNPGGTSGFTFSVNTNPATVVVQNPGSNYQSAPAVTFSKPQKSGEAATGIAILNSEQVQSVEITSAGSGYTHPPTVSFTSTTGSGAAAAVSLAPDNYYYAITAVKEEFIARVTDGGSNYTSAPGVNISAPQAGGTTAAGIAILGSGANADKVVEIKIIHSGSGYQTAPSITLSGGGGQGATAELRFNESMTGAIQAQTINAGTLAVVNWRTYPGATRYNVYRSKHANLEGAQRLNGDTPYTSQALANNSSLEHTVTSTSSSVTVSTPLTDTIPKVGTLLVSDGVNEGLFQYTAVDISQSTFTGTMFSTVDFDAGSSVTLLPQYLDNGTPSADAGDEVATPPDNNYFFEPLNAYFTDAIKDFFDYYRPVKNSDDKAAKDKNSDLRKFEIDIAGEVSTKWTGHTSEQIINGETYTVLTLTGEQGIYGGNYAGKTVNIYQPFFSSNVPDDAFNPPIPLPKAPDWLTDKQASPSAMVFGASGCFGTADNVGIPNPAAPLSTAPPAIVKDVMNPINAALNRGLTPRRNPDRSWPKEVLKPMYWAQAPLFPLTATVSQSATASLAKHTYYYAIAGVNVNGDSSNQETIPGNIVTVQSDELSSSNNNQVTLTIPNTGVTTFTAFNVYRGTSPTAMKKITSVTPASTGSTTLVDTGLADGTKAPPHTMNAPGQLANWYAAYLHQLDVSINGLSYGTPYDDQGGFSSNVNITYTGSTPNPPQGLTITLLPWNE
ncbi:hypothetical protein [Planctobacterium marinum]|uniref:Uncharacterized protein n=1 Tax=Planctobacterium marinum TaxID=1631968 RepID=A0AA48I2P1_9ALTE|nr:hypothetical protein MACH26_03360 [Planctobacterium marinum]